MLVRALALGLLTSALSALAPVAASADGVRDLDLTGFSEMVVDSEHGRIFISQGNGGVVVLALDGSPVATLPGLAGAQGMWLDPSSDTLWVAASQAGVVGEVDTATLAVTTHATGPGSCPHDVASGEGSVWFADECGASSIAALDPSTGQVTSFSAPDRRRWRVAMSPEVPGRLFAVAEGAALLAVFEITGGTGPTLSAEVEPIPTQGGNDLVFTPDGRAVVLASGDLYSTAEFLIPLGGYHQTSSVAVRADGRVAGVHDGGWRAYDAHPLSNVPEVRPFATGGWADEVIQPRGLAWGDVALYAVTQRAHDGRFLLHAVLPKRRSSVSVSTPRSSYWYGSNAAVHVALRGAQSSRLVSLYAQPRGERRVLVTRSQVPTQGLTLRYRMERTTTFTVVFSENVDTLGAHDQVTVKVPTQVELFAEGRPRDLDLVHTYRVGRRATFRVEIRPPEESYRVVTQVWAEGYGRRLLVGRSKSLRMNDRGIARVYVDGFRGFVGWRMEIRAIWYRTKDSAPARRSQAVKFRFVR